MSVSGNQHKNFLNGMCLNNLPFVKFDPETEGRNAMNANLEFGFVTLGIPYNRCTKLTYERMKT